MRLRAVHTTLTMLALAAACSVDDGLTLQPGDVPTDGGVAAVDATVAEMDAGESIDGGAEDLDAGGIDAGGIDAAVEDQFCAQDQRDGVLRDPQGPMNVARVCATVGSDGITHVVMDGIVGGCGVADARCESELRVETNMCARRCGAGIDKARLETDCGERAPASSMFVDGVRLGRVAPPACYLNAQGRYWPIQRVRSVLESSPGYDVLCDDDDQVPSPLEPQGQITPAIVCAVRRGTAVDVQIDGLIHGCGVPDVVCDDQISIRTSMCGRRCGAGLDAWRVRITCAAAPAETLSIDGRRMGVIMDGGAEVCFPFETRE